MGLIIQKKYISFFFVEAALPQLFRFVDLIAQMQIEP
jgi:hypothetical protein